MKTTDIALKATLESESVVDLVEQSCRAAGLHCTMKDTLRTYPGSVHWHFKNGTMPGTLEVTYWPLEHRAWISVQSRRGADWIHEALPLIQEQLCERE